LEYDSKPVLLSIKQKITMTKRILLLSMGVCMFLSQIMAATVSVQTAQLVAKNFYKGAAPTAGAVTPTLLYTRTESDGTVDYYIFGVAPLTGFVIVSADDICEADHGLLYRGQL
jgi:hypothetical protein